MRFLLPSSQSSSFYSSLSLFVASFVFLAGCAGGDPAEPSAEPAASPDDAGTDDFVLPTSTLVVDGDTFYLTNVTETPVGNVQAYRLQLNFGTEAQLRENPDEPGQNSTLALTLGFLNEPTSGDYTFSSQRFLSPGDDDKVNFYLTFFLNQGNARDGLNFLSPDVGTLSFTIDGDDLSVNIPDVVLTDEAGSGDSFTLSGDVAVTR